MLYAAIAVCACMFVFGGQLGEREARVPKPGLSASDMTLTVGDFPEGAFVMEQDKQTSVGVKDGYQRLFGMCDCRIGDSAPMFAVASVNILDGEELAKLGMEAAASDFGRDFLSAQFDKGADGAATASELRTLPGPTVGDESIVMELPFSWRELGTGVAYIGVIRIREVIATVAIGGRGGKVHAGDLHGLMRLAAGRVTGEAPPAEENTPASPVGATA